MCGITGILSIARPPTPPSRELLIAMISTLRHRGPDCYGIYRDHACGLAHARLSIVDLASGDQPMSTEDGQLSVVFNGEIYNFIELREELEKYGHRFRTRSDTEVILYAYRQWGKECFHRFNGQWALALRDLRSEELLLCRDRVGVRPLYYTPHRSRILFGSEIKALFADPSVPRAIRPQTLAETFTYWCPLSPSTLFEGVEEVPPGSYLMVKADGTTTMSKYWDVPFAQPQERLKAGDIRRTAEELGGLLRDAVRLRMIRADVPVGSYLSGGLDSSLIAAYARDHAASVFHTFSVRFTDPQFDETPYQRMMIDRLGCTHHDISVSGKDIAGIFPDVVYHAEQPLLRTAPAPLYSLSRLVREHGIKTVLTGEGADEFLAGYDIFREAKIREFWSRRPDSAMRPALFDRIYPYLTRSPRQARAMANAFWKIGLENTSDAWYTHDRRWSTGTTLCRFFTQDFAATAEMDDDDAIPLPADFTSWDMLNRGQLLEIRTFFSQYLLSAQGDRMLMAHGIEGRFPFLDHRVMEYCSRIPVEQLLPGLREKAVLKILAGGTVPEPIIRRPKQPYRAPDAVCFVGEGTPSWVREILAPEAVAAAGIFDPAMVSGLLSKLSEAAKKDGAHATPGNTDNMALTGIISTQLLHHRFVHGDPRPLRGTPPAWILKVDLHRGKP